MPELSAITLFSSIAALAGFAVVMALGQFSPGPDMLWLTRVALRDGGRAGIFTALGIACGLAVHATLALTGLALLLHRHAGLRLGFTLAAACYLGWLAWRIARASGTSVDGSASTKPVSRPFLRGVACNLANPKAALFIAAVCTPFLEFARPPWFAVALWCVIVFQGAFLWSLWAMVLQLPGARMFYQRHARHIDIAFAATLAVVAGWLLLNGVYC